MLLDTVKKKKQHSKIHLKPDFKLIKPTDKKGENEPEFAPCSGPSSWAYVSGTNKALKENVLNSLFTYY